MRLSVVIPTLGRSPALPEALDRLRAQRDAPPFEVLLVVDAAGAAPDAGAGVRVLRAGRPGASAARNAGWRAAQAPVVLFLGDDILASPGLVAAHAAHHARRPEPEAALLGHVRWARRPRPNAFMRWLERGMQADYASIDGDRAGWGHFYTTNVSVKRSLLEHAGGFDEDLPFLYEDLDLGRRLDALGMDLRYAPEAVGEHLHPATLESWQGRIEAIGRAERRFCAKHPDVAPYFRERLSRAAAGAPARGRGARLAALVPREVPWLGPRVWWSAEAYFAQQLWPAFARGWEAAQASERATSSAGSPPGGPK